MTHPYAGIIAAPVLPMKDGGEIDWECLPAYADWLVEQRPLGLAINMDAGEGHSLTRQERRQVLELYIARAHGRCKVLAGIIGNTTREAVELGCEARAMGADAIVLFPPLPVFLGAPLADELPYAFHREVAEVVDLPLVVFQLPRGIGPDYSPALLGRLAGLEQIVAIKDASFDSLKLLEIREALKDAPHPIAVLTGADQMLLEQMLTGADGALIGFASTLTREVIDLYQAACRGDLDRARRLWDRIGPLARYAWRPPFRDYRPRMKEVLRLQGLFRSAEVRRPLLPVSEAEGRRLRELAAAAGLV